ncbi:MAG: hypothetical protein ACO1N3_05080 [Gammaproteobacteria bacterium]
MSNLSSEIELLRNGEISGFLHFYNRIIRNYPESRNSKADMILYAACELVAADFKDQDAGLIYILENKIFDDPEYSGYFLTEFSMTLKDGAAILKDAVALAKYIRQQNISIPMGEDHKPDINNLSKSLGNNQLEMVTIQEEFDQKTRSGEFATQERLANESLTRFTNIPEWQTNLFFHLREYRYYLESKLDTQPENQKSIDLLNQILNSDTQFTENNIKKFIELQKPTDSLGEALLQKINKLLTYVFNKELYKQYEAFNAYRSSWQETPNAASKSLAAENEDKENQKPNVQRKGSV